MSTEEYSVSGRVWVLTASIATLGVNSLSLGPIAPAISADFATPVNTVMIAAGCYGVCTAAGALFLSHLIDRHGVKRALLVSLVVLTLSFVLSGLAPGMVSLVISQSLAGFAAGVALPAIYSFTARISPKGQESAILGRVLFGWTISIMAGVTLSTLIADYAHWRAVFAVLAVICALVVILVRQLPEPTETLASQNDARPGVSPFGALRIAGVAPLLLVCLALMTSFYGVYGYIGDHFHQRLGLTLSAVGLLAVSYGAGFGIAMFGDTYIDRIGANRAFPWCLVIVGSVYIAAGVFSHSYWMLVALSFFWGLGNHFGLNLIVAGLSAIDPARRGAILGLNSAVTYLSASLGAIGLGVVYARLDFEWLAWSGGMMVLASAVYIALANRRPKEPVVGATNHP